MLCDCHVHLASYGSEDLPGVIERSRQAGVHLIITAGTTLDTSRVCTTLASQYSSVYASVGIHPNRVRAPLTDNDLHALADLARNSPKVIAHSETGMDYMPNAPDLALQEQAFRMQIRLCHELKLPLIWHSQVTEPNWAGQHPETLRLLQEERAGDLGGVMHYFQADEWTARAAIDGGFLISFAKPLLRQPHQEEIVRGLPLEHIVLETDASPQPWKPTRADWTEPKDVSLVARRIAQIKGITVEEVAQATTANLLRLLRLNEASLPQPR